MESAFQLDEAGEQDSSLLRIQGVGAGYGCPKTVRG